MAYSQDVKDKVLNLLLKGKTAKQISNKNGGEPSESTIKRWIKNEIIDFDINNVTLKQTPSASTGNKSTSRKEWGLNKYSKKHKEQGTNEKELREDLWEDVDNYKSALKDFVESAARREYHGSTLEDKLHLGIYQVHTKGVTTPRTKQVGKLTSQDHIFPHSKMKNHEDSYHPENIREGHALFNIYIKAKIDPVFISCKKGKAISKSTADMIQKYNLENSLKDHVSFKYFNDRIVTSNMVKKLTVSTGKSFEAPDPGILNGPKKDVSIKAYSVPLYKINTAAGIIDVSTCNKNLLNLFENNLQKGKAQALLIKAAGNKSKTTLHKLLNKMDSDDIQNALITTTENNNKLAMCTLLKEIDSDDIQATLDIVHQNGSEEVATLLGDNM
jgi:hypothetical protein